MVKLVGKLWAQIKSQTMKGMAIIIVTFLSGIASAVLLGAWGTVKLPFENKNAIEAQQEINLLQDEAISRKLDATEFHQYKREEAIKESNTQEILREIQEDQRTIISILTKK